LSRAPPPTNPARIPSLSDRESRSPSLGISVEVKGDARRCCWFEVISVVRRRRKWSSEQKLALVEEVDQPGSPLAAMADRMG
jgi:hypothetical protein